MSICVTKLNKLLARRIVVCRVNIDLTNRLGPLEKGSKEGDTPVLSCYDSFSMLTP